MADRSKKSNPILIKKNQSFSSGVVVKGRKIGRQRFQESVYLAVPKNAESGLRSTNVASALLDRVESLQRRNLQEKAPETTRETLLRIRKKRKRKDRSYKIRNTQGALW